MTGGKEADCKTKWGEGGGWIYLLAMALSERGREEERGGAVDCIVLGPKGGGGGGARMCLLAMALACLLACLLLVWLFCSGSMLTYAHVSIRPSFSNVVFRHICVSLYVRA